MHAVANLVEELHRVGVAVPPFPEIEVPPMLKRAEWGSGPTPEEVEQDRKFQVAINEWRDAVRALHAEHVGGADR